MQQLPQKARRERHAMQLQHGKRRAAAQQSDVRRRERQRRRRTRASTARLS